MTSSDVINTYAAWRLRRIDDQEAAKQLGVPHSEWRTIVQLVSTGTIQSVVQYINSVRK